MTTAEVLPAVPAGVATTVRVGVATTVRVGSGMVTVLLGGEETNGAYTLFAEVTDPAGAVPVHLHEREDEAFFILAGRFEFQVGDRTITVGPGEFLVAPRGVPHTYRNLDATPSHKLALAWPAGLDRFFLEVGQPVAAPAETSPVPNEHVAIPGLAEMAARYGMTILAPPAAGHPE
jgi:mannose-6-phosphate isomerase-like protein (cupin superfamily)